MQTKTDRHTDREAERMSGRGGRREVGWEREKEQTERKIGQ